MAQAALERERRPALLLDDKGVVTFVNHGVVSLLGWAPSEITGCAWRELCVQPHRRDETTAKLAEALERNSTSTVLPCVTRTGEALALVTEITPVACHPRRYLLILIVDVKQDLPTSPRVTGQETYYEIASPASGNFGLIRHAWGRPSDFRARPGDRCFRVLYERESPCPECPASRLGEQQREIVAVLARPGPSVTLNVVRASMISTDFVAISVFPVTESLFSQLLQKKISLLASRGGLSARERSVLDLLLLGRTTDDIASVLKISARTVKYHQSNIQAKLGAESRADLVRLLL